MTLQIECCEQCNHADKQEQEAILNDIDAVIESLVSTFEAEWERAPQAMRRYCEQAIAAYWWERGRQVERLTQNQDLTEMNRLMKERMNDV